VTRDLLRLEVGIAELSGVKTAGFPEAISRPRIWMILGVGVTAAVLGVASCRPSSLSRGRMAVEC